MFWLIVLGGIFTVWLIAKTFSPSVTRLEKRVAAIQEKLEEKRPTKVCPDCAETVLLAARLCRHCGHKFTDKYYISLVEFGPKPSSTINALCKISGKDIIDDLLNIQNENHLPANVAIIESAKVESARKMLKEVGAAVQILPFGSSTQLAIQDAKNRLDF